MPGYSDTPDDELESRFNTLLDRLEKNLKSVAPILLSISKDREEGEAIVEELRKRGLAPGKDATS